MSRESITSNTPVTTQSYDYKKPIRESGKTHQVCEVTMCRNHDNTTGDTAHFTSQNNDTNTKLNDIYNRLTNICACVGISIEDAKRNRLFEIVAGVNTQEEINKLSEDEINRIISTIDETFSFMLNPKARAKSVIRKIPFIGEKLAGKTTDEDIQRLAAEAKNRIIIKKHGISRRKQAWFELTHKNLSEKIQKYLPTDREPSTEDFKNAGIQLFKDELGKINNLSPEKKEKKYKELKENFYLYFTKITNGDSEAAEQAMSAALSVLKADDRIEAAEDFITAAPDNTRKAYRARAVQTSAEVNLTTQDALGNIVSENDAVKYYCTTFGNMDSQGIQDSLTEMDTRSGDIIQKYNALLAKKANTGLSPEEQSMLEQLEVLQNRCVVSAYTGASIGIQMNSMLTSSESQRHVSQTLSAAERHGILDSVLVQTANYLNNNSTAYTAVQRENIIHTLNKHTNNRYNQLQANASYSCPNKSNQSKAESYQTNKNSSVTHHAQEEAQENNSQAEIHNVNLTKAKSNTEESHITSNKPELHTPEKDNIKKSVVTNTVLPTDNKTKAFNQAICTSMKMVEEYKNSYDVTNRELYIDILNAHRKNRVAKEWAIRQFKNEDNATQIDIYNNGITISENKIAVARIMDPELLKRTKRDCSNAYVKNIEEKIIEEYDKKA